MEPAPGNARAGPVEEGVTSEQPATPGRTAENDPPPGQGTRGGGEGHLRRLSWLLPALAFVVGVALGALVVTAVDSAGSRAGTTAGGAGPVTAGSGPAGTTPSPGTSGDLTVTVPAECAALADDARDAANLLEQGAAAARDLDAKALADVVRRMQDARDRLAAQADACRGAAPSASASSS
jgi:hypothetical protein